MTPRLNFIYLHSEKIGYGYHGQKTADALSRIGVEVYDGLPGSGDLDLDKKRARICKDVLYLTVPSHVAGWWEGQRAHLFTMWEATELPAGMREGIEHFETILVPSEECRKLFSQYHPNVRMVPLGVDSERWKYTPRRTNDIFFNFMIAGTGTRKGNDLVHRAFMQEFSGRDLGGPIPRLIMKNPKGENYGGEGVEVMSGFMTPEDEVSLYESAHCYVQPSRGEGWGMQPLQAMAQGCPTILTDAHGHAPFARYGIGLSASRVRTDAMTLFGDAGEWWEPNYDELVAAMKHVYNNYRQHCERAARNAVLIADRFTWERSAQAIVNAIGGTKALSEEYVPSLDAEWFVPDVQLYRVITKRDWKADIGGTTHLLKEGVEYWKPADVKRVLYDGGVLDPSAIEGGGLTRAQLESVGAYIDHHSRCPTCGDSLDHSDLEEELVSCR